MGWESQPLLAPCNCICALLMAVCPHQAWTPSLWINLPISVSRSACIALRVNYLAFFVISDFAPSSPRVFARPRKGLTFRQGSLHKQFFFLPCDTFARGKREYSAANLLLVGNRQETSFVFIYWNNPICLPKARRTNWISLDDRRGFHMIDRCFPFQERLGEEYCISSPFPGRIVTDTGP
jgi:hypothetical protein